MNIYCLSTLFISNLFLPNGKDQPVKPNIIVIFCDDMGYGDLGTYGNPTIRTPNIDRMAAEGQKWTNFYASSPVSTPSRAGLLTGRLPVRSGMASEKRRVLYPESKGGLPQTEITIARKIKENGYSTACIGKWHLGHLPQYRPNDHGFDYYFGIPYSNDMDRVKEGPYFEVMKMIPRVEYFNVPLMRNTEIIERPADQYTITKRYTEEAVKFIMDNAKKPFFIYLAHSMPHIPLFASKDFEGKSLRGLYGDVIEELDWSVGQILEALKTNKLDKNTLVIFTSDNGPWLTFNEYGGSAGLLRGGKGGTFDGGMREPAIFWWPGKIKPDVIMEIGSTLDIFPTICALTKTQIPSDRIYDGYDISPVLFGLGKSPRNEIFFYRDTMVFAVRKGEWKAHFITQDDYLSEDKIICDPPLLYNLNLDPSEQHNVAKENPEIASEIKQLMEVHKATVVPVINQLER